MSAIDPGPVQLRTSAEPSRTPQRTTKRVDTLPDRAEAEELRRRYDELTAITARLIKECWRLQADNHDLRASARMWVSMYEQQLDRANSLEQHIYQGPRRG